MFIHYKANLTCGDECFRLSRVDQDEAVEFYSNQVDNLLSAARAKTNARFFLDDRPVEIFYFRGRKGTVFSTCNGITIQDGVDKRISACSKQFVYCILVHS